MYRLTKTFLFSLIYNNGGVNKLKIQNPKPRSKYKGTFTRNFSVFFQMFGRKINNIIELIVRGSKKNIIKRLEEKNWKTEENSKLWWKATIVVSL